MTETADRTTRKPVARARMRLVHGVVLLTSWLAACAALAPMEQQAVDYNRVVEEEQNRVLLLNVLRAKDQRPLHFTALSQARGSWSVSAGISALLPMGGAADELTPELGFSTNPSFDVAVLNSEKFIRGIVTPVEMEVFRYYAEQGWDPELLCYLFIRTIAEDMLDPYVNHPADAEAFRRFKRRVERLVGHGEPRESFAFTTERRPVGPPLPSKKVTGELVMEARKQKLELASAGDRYQLNETVTCLLAEGRVFTAREQPEPVALADAKARGQVWIRSPEAMIYYLGEITRALEARAKDVVELRVCSGGISGRHPERLFVARKSKAGECAADWAVHVSYRGETWVIPADRNQAGQSMHCLSLVAQMLGLHRSSDEMPTTRAVTLVGR